MSSLLHLPAAARPSRPWKNGGGRTADVAIEPAGASLDDFDWRVSIAQVETGGPFSEFPGVERIMAILSGEGLRLAVADAPPVTLTPDGAPHAYPGDQPTDCRLLGGPVTDLNVMARRGRVAARLTPIRLAAGAEETVESGPALLVWVSGRGLAEVGDRRLSPAALDALRCREAACWRLRAETDCLAYLAEFS